MFIFLPSGINQWGLLWSFRLRWRYLVSVILWCYLLLFWRIHAYIFTSWPFAAATAAHLLDLEVICKPFIDNLDVHSPLLIDFLLQFINTLVHRRLLGVKVFLLQIIYYLLLGLGVLNVCFVLFNLLRLGCVQLTGQLFVLESQHFFLLLHFLQLC